MPSFDISSSVDLHELTNAVDQSNRELTTRFDFKGVNASFTLVDNKEVLLKAPSEFQVQQMADILRNKCAKRQIDVRSLSFQAMEKNLSEARQTAEVLQGISKEQAKKIIKHIKSSKIKVQPAVQGDQIRITGKKRDDLQAVIQLLKKEDFDIPLNYENFRD